MYGKHGRLSGNYLKLGDYLVGLPALVRVETLRGLLSPAEHSSYFRWAPRRLTSSSPFRRSFILVLPNARPKFLILLRHIVLVPFRSGGGVCEKPRLSSG